MIKTYKDYQQAVAELDALLDQDPENTTVEDLLWEIQQYELNQRDSFVDC